MRVHSDDVDLGFRFKRVDKLLVFCQLFLSWRVEQVRVIVDVVKFVELFIVLEDDAQDRISFGELVQQVEPL